MKRWSVSGCLLLVAISLSPLEAAPQEERARFVAGLWLLYVDEVGYHRWNDEAVRFPAANREQGADRLACVVEGGSGQNLLSIELVAGGFVGAETSRLFATSEARASTVFSAGAAGRRRIEEFVWSPDGELLLVSASRSRGGRAEYEVKLLKGGRELESPFQDREIRRSGFVIASRDRLFFRRGDTVVEREGVETRELFTGHAYDLAYLKDPDALLHYGDEKNNTGIYLWRLGGWFSSGSRSAVINLPVTSELSPRHVGDASGWLAFLSNFDPADPEVESSGERNDIRRRWRLYTERMEGLSRQSSEQLVKSLRPAAQGILVEDRDYEKPGFRNHKVLVWHDSRVYFLAQDQAYHDALISFEPASRVTSIVRLDPIDQTLHTGGKQNAFEIKGRVGSIRSFDVFESRGTRYIAASVTAALEVTDSHGKRQRWPSDAYLVLYQIP